jgi:hypothetical protein
LREEKTIRDMRQVERARNHEIESAKARESDELNQHRLLKII